MVPWGPSVVIVKPVMYPSCSRIPAILALTLEAGTSTFALRAMMALRIRVRKSAIGSVMASLSPARFDDARDLAAQRQPTEADAAHLELAQITARPAAYLAAVVLAHFELLLPLDHVYEFRHVQLRNGMPSCLSSARPSSSVRAVVPMVTLSPLILSILS